MNKEIKEITSQLKEILNKYPDRQLEILLYVFGRDNLMNMINEPTYEELQQENQILKEQLKDENNYHNEAVKWYKESFDIEQERIKYKSVLDEIREYIKELDDNTDDTTCYDIDRNVRDDLLQILDKVKE